MLNPLHLATDILHYYFTSPNLMKKYNIGDKDDAKKVKRIITSLFNRTKINEFFE